VACRKCGSSWTTQSGKNCAACPACCKQARCRARRLGLLKNESPEPRECVGCGVTFLAATPVEMAKKKFCTDECHRQTRVARAREHRKFPPKAPARAAKPKSAPRHCLVCSKKLVKVQRKYCGNACFVRAKELGIQQWDRSSIVDAARNRPSNATQSPWLYVPTECASNFSAFMHKIRALWRPVCCPEQLFDCMVCGRICLNGSRTHCSRGCGNRTMLVGECRTCRTQIMHKATSRKPRCRRCKRRADKGNLLAKNHRKRCRKNGVPFDPSIKSRDVFARDNYVCHVCKRKVLPDFTVRGGVVHPRSPTVDHHPYPLSVGIMGHTWDNVRCACWDCNTKKGAEWSGQLPLRIDADGPA